MSSTHGCAGQETAAIEGIIIALHFHFSGKVWCGFQLIERKNVKITDINPRSPVSQVKNLIVGYKPTSQSGIIDILHTDSRINSKAGGSSCRLSENHEDRLHANRSERNM